MLQLLTLCTNLQKCKLRIGHPRTPPLPADRQQPLVCPNMRSLSLDARSGDMDHERFFAAVHFPNLEEIESVKAISDMELRPFEWCMTSIEEFVARCQPPLKKISFYGSAPTDFELMCFAKRMVCLREVLFVVIGKQTRKVSREVVNLLESR